MNGTMVGGWEYVWAAYGITWAALAIYAVSLLWREKKTRRKPQARKPEWSRGLAYRRRSFGGRSFGGHGHVSRAESARPLYWQEDTFSTGYPGTEGRKRRQFGSKGWARAAWCQSDR